jgi:hypothetical protein
MEQWFLKDFNHFNFIVKTELLPLAQQSSILSGLRLYGLEVKPIIPIFQHSNIPIGAKP